MLLCLMSFVHYVCVILYGCGMELQSIYSILFLQSSLSCPTVYVPISLLVDILAVSAFWLTLIKL